MKLKPYQLSLIKMISENKKIIIFPLPSRSLQKEIINKSWRAWLLKKIQDAEKSNLT